MCSRTPLAASLSAIPPADTAALGFKPATLGQAILAIFILAALFHVLFQSFNKTLHMGRFRSTCWSLLHFPLHVCVRAC